MRRVSLLLVLTASVMHLGIINPGAPASAATCGIDANVDVNPNGSGGWNVGGAANAFCSAPPPSFNYIEVSVRPENALYGLLLNGTRTFSGSCDNGACSITPVFYGYGVPANAIVTLLNGNAPLCFTASVFATYGGTRTDRDCG